MPAKLTKEQIVIREKRVTDEAIDAKRDPATAIFEDRMRRWSIFLKDFQVRPEISEWAQKMTEKFRRDDKVLTGEEFDGALEGEVVPGVDGTMCRIHGDDVSWVLALLIVRYGQAEYHWPDEGFSDEDVQRAKEWYLGRTPEAVAYL